MEFLSKEFDASTNSFPVNIVMHTPQTKEKGYNATLAGTWVRANLPFDPTNGFHEYRIDFLSDNVYFYGDGTVLAQMNGTGIPSTGGHLLISHWSSGNPKWSEGPPATQADIQISYAKAYFNSSAPNRQQDFVRRCTNPGEKDATCAIPAVPKDNGAATFFFSNKAELVVNQSVPTGGPSGSGSGGSSGGGSKNAGSAVVPQVLSSLALGALALVALAA